MAMNGRPHAEATCHREPYPPSPSEIWVRVWMGDRDDHSDEAPAWRMGLDGSIHEILHFIRGNWQCSNQADDEDEDDDDDEPETLLVLLEPHGPWRVHRTVPDRVTHMYAHVCMQ